MKDTIPQPPHLRGLNEIGETKTWHKTCMEITVLYTYYKISIKRKTLYSKKSCIGSKIKINIVNPK